MAKAKRLTASLEDYLEAIWHLVQDKQVARSKDIADRLDVNKSSVTGALKNLSARGLVQYEAYQFATLTEKGRKAAIEVVRRHEIIRDFLTQILQITPAVAEESACRIEHALEGEALEKLVQFVDFVQTCPRTESGWIEGFRKFCREGPELERCRDCLDDCIDELHAALPRGKTPPESVSLLSEIDAGEKGRILEISPEEVLTEALKTQGLVAGALVEVEEVNPEEERIAVKVRGYHLQLKKKQAEAVKVIKV
ncbi:MAG: metal-dependent transcriptional regulator [Planctomycetota bacterium]|jgi:DtxR family Mn-dependent transcriptional regulator